ncbi:MAG: sulfatase [Planctomycetes bacterium]|nr:sulfatase [Planctomycetota bacterium]
MSGEKLNVVFVFADQWRYQALGFSGDPNAKTPCLDRLAAEGIHFTHALSGHPVCCPARASLLTGQQPLTHGVFLNDLPLRPKGTTLGEAFKRAGYRTGYIGKWHVDGQGRSNYIPPERRLGFEFWRAQECTHDYNRSPYFTETGEARVWDGYDAAAQTREAQRFMRERASGDPFLLVLSWGPPHNPYETAPQRFRALHDPARIQLRPNVPAALAETARNELAGYYAHGSALDAYVGELRGTLRECGIADRTLFVFWSDHGDMLHSQGQRRKQRPWDESVRVPLLLDCPALFGRQARAVDALIDTPDLAPTLLDLAGLAVPDTMQGRSYAPYLLKGAPAPAEAVLLGCPSPFGEFLRKDGAKEYRGVRTRRHTYVKTHDGAWLLYDNARDPYQMNNLAGRLEAAGLQAELERALQGLLDRDGDRFEPGQAYIDRWGYKPDANGTMPYA